MCNVIAKIFGNRMFDELKEVKYFKNNRFQESYNKKYFKEINK